jgi:genome maintenance exonuclease 1
VGLHYEGRYAGTTDMVAQYRGKLAIVDFKQALKPKRHEWITDYYHQLAAYALAHDKMFGTNIELGVILVAVQDGSTQEFTTAGREFEDYKAGWMERLNRAEAAAVAGQPSR